MQKNITKSLFVIISFLFLASSAFTLTCTDLTKPLSKGSENADVLTLQQFLFDAGYLPVKPNGYFGENTKKAVSAFQKKENINTTGAAGPFTRARIKEISCATSSAVVKKVVDNSTTTKAEIKMTATIKDIPVVIPVKETLQAVIVTQEIPTIYVKTLLAGDIVADGATLKGSGGVDGEKHWFEWGNTMEMKNVTPQTVASTSYTYKLTGLLPNIPYYFRAVTSLASSTNRKEETVYGEMRYFTTPAVAMVTQVLPIVSISSSGVAVDIIGSTKVTWASANTTTCNFTQGEEGGDWTNQRSLSGQYITKPITKSTVFSISCSNITGYTVNSSVTVSKVAN